MELNATVINFLFTSTVVQSKIEYISRFIYIYIYIYTMRMTKRQKRKGTNYNNMTRWEEYTLAYFVLLKVKVP